MIDPHGASSGGKKEIPAVLAPETSRAKKTGTAEPAATPEPGTKPEPAATPEPGTKAKPTAGAPKAMKLSRRDLERSLSNFASLSREAQIERAPGGGVRIVQLSRGSFFSRIGLEAGDIVRRVAGHAIDSVDAAAGAYAAVISAREVLVEIERRGRPVALRYHLVD